MKLPPRNASTQRTRALMPPICASVRATAAIRMPRVVQQSATASTRSTRAGMSEPRLSAGRPISGSRNMPAAKRITTCSTTITKLGISLPTSIGHLPRGDASSRRKVPVFFSS